MPFPFIPLALSALSFFGGSRKPPAATSSSNNTATSMPTLDPAYKGLQDIILPSITKRLSNPTGLPEGYGDGAVNNINRNFQLAQQNSENDLASRGLGTSPVAASVMGRLNAARVGEISRFQNTLPLIQQQNRNDDLEVALRVLSGGRGNTMTSTGSSTGQAQGGGASGGFSNLADMLGFLIGSGQFGGNKGGGTALLNNKMNPMDFLSPYK